MGSQALIAFHNYSPPRFAAIDMPGSNTLADDVIWLAYRWHFWRNRQRLDSGIRLFCGRLSKHGIKEQRMSEAEVLEQRRQARAAKHLIDESLVVLHQKAVIALLDPTEAKHVRAQALEQVAKWERGHLCNPRYVQAWRNILSLPAAAMRAAILQDDPEGISLRQNSPFGFLATRAR